jgi:tetratricopeptide (TPR) repeat protein
VSSTRPALVLATCLALGAATAVRAELAVWLDAEGGTHVSDRPVDGAEAGATLASDVDELRSLWDTQRGGETASGGDSSGEAERTRRILRAALDDLARGETARATAALESVLRSEPAQPEAHFYLALLDRQRGRFLAAEEHLRAFLAHAGSEYEAWRPSAERRLRAIETERRLAEGEGDAREPRFVRVPAEHFQVEFDADLAAGSADYAQGVVRFLEESRQHVGSLLGVYPDEPTGVVLYSRAAYAQAHRQRFSFQTVGFYDGRIHVVSAAHPAGELRALLFHEYAHALFEDRVGGHRPFWLNEGWAELAEQLALGRPALTRSERSQLRTAIGEGRWIPLARLATSFAGLDDAEARLAYLESTATAAWIAERTRPADRARLLDHLGAGAPPDVALVAVVGADTDGVDAAVRAAILAEFPPI